MKTLDQVIEAVENCFCLTDPIKGCDQCPYYGECNKQGDPYRDDMLYYLKMYRSDMKMYVENQKHWETELLQKIKDFGDAKDRYIKRLKELAELKRNDPLSWEELKTMEGKPVWFEVLDPEALPALDRNGWGLAGRSTFTTWEGVECFSLIRIGVTYALPTADYNKTWQAYRKELS